MKRFFLSITAILYCIGSLGNEATLMVSALGFNPKDSTAILQKALDSDASRIIIDKQDVPWVTGPLFCNRSNLEIIIEKGASIQALPNAFKGRYESLLTIDSQRNISINGNGAVVSMNKAEYQDRKRYSPAEWRHLINLLSAENITIENITLARSGGDGIYIGVSRKKNALPYCKDITLTNVVCDDNHRQGISVISVDGLAINSCTLKNTRGTAPEYGIDFEPNQKLEQLTRCVIRDCRFSNNNGAAIGTFIRLGKDAKPIEIRLENCVINGYIELGMAAGRFSSSNAVTGEILFQNCRIKGSGTLFKFNQYRSDSHKAVFENCTIERTSDYEKPLLQFFNSADLLQPTGNVFFKNCKVKGAISTPIEYHSSYTPNNRAEKIEGILSCDQKQINLAEYVKEQAFDKSRFSADRNIDWKKLNIHSTEPMIPSPRIRGPLAFILSANQAKTVTFALYLRQPSGKKNNRKMNLKLIDPNGKAINLPPASAAQEINEYKFQVDSPGNYRLECNPNGLETALVHCNVPFVVMPIKDSFIHLFKPTGKLFFRAPQNEEISVLIGGEGFEHVTATLEDENNKLDSIQQTTAVAELKGVSVSGHPTLNVKHCVEDVKFRIPAPALPVFSNNPAVQFDFNSN